MTAKVSGNEVVIRNAKEDVEMSIYPRRRRGIREKDGFLAPKETCEYTEAYLYSRHSLRYKGSLRGHQGARDCFLSLPKRKETK